MKIKHIQTLMDNYAQEKTAYSWDNSGMQIGELNEELTGILLCVDVIDTVIDEAIEKNCNMIISHHPFMFNAVKNIVTGSKSRLIKKIIKNNLSVYSSHTCFDMCHGGINDFLAEKFGLKSTKYLEDAEGFDVGMGVIGKVDEISAMDLIEKSKKVFSCERLRVSNNYIDKQIKKVAICGGSGTSFLQDAYKLGADVIITADAKWRDFLWAYEKGILIICPTHFESEFCFTEIAKNYLEKHISGDMIIVSEAKDTELFI